MIATEESGVVPSTSIGIPLVSIIIPCFQGAEFIERCIASAFAQSYERVEVIVVDDGSTDGSYDFALQLREERFPELILVTHDNRANCGVSVSRYVGLQHAKGELIAFLDADDELVSEKLSRQVSVMLANPDVVLCHTAVRATGNEALAAYQESYFRQHPSGPYFVRKRPRYLKTNYICTSTVLVRANVLRRIPFAMTQVFQYEDWLCWVLLGRFGKFIFLDEPLTTYRIHPASATAAVQRNRLRVHYSTLEFKLALAARSESVWLSMRCLASAATSLVSLLLAYLPSGDCPTSVLPCRINLGSRILLAIARGRSDGSGSGQDSMGGDVV